MSTMSYAPRLAKLYAKFSVSQAFLYYLKSIVSYEMEIITHIIGFRSSGMSDHHHTG